MGQWSDQEPSVCDTKESSQLLVHSYLLCFLMYSYVLYVCMYVCIYHVAWMYVCIIIAADQEPLSPRLETGNSPAGSTTGPHSLILLCYVHIYVFVCIYVCSMDVCLYIADQWSDQEHLSPWLATGNSPAGYWSTVNLL